MKPRTENTRSRGVFTPLLALAVLICSVIAASGRVERSRRSRHDDYLGN